MSKLGELIAELCPDGVEYKRLADVTTIARGVRVVRSQLAETGKFPVYQNSMKPLGYYEKANCPAKTTFIIGAGAAGEVGYCDVDFWAADDCYYFEYSDEINSRYLFHVLLLRKQQLLSQVRKASVPRLARTVIEALVIPVPHLEVQREIVRILDSFTFLTAELTAELTARKKQYEFYRNKLFSFGDNVEWKKLGEIGKVSMCKRIMKNETSAEGDIPFYKIGTFGGKPNAFISKETFEKYKNQYSYPKKGDILISAAGTIGRTIVFDGKPAYFQDSNIVWIDNDETQVLNEFLYYWYQTSPWKVSTGGTIARLYNDNIAGANVPVMPLEIQKKLVYALGNFDAVCNDLNIGLPAEIEARQKQYEYYREKLLTFKEPSK